MKFELCTIASGSSGNCIYIGTDKKKILIDAGISGKRVTLGLQEIGVDPSEINGVFITHEHTDHIQGAGIISRKYDLPIYATKKTWDSILDSKKIGKVKEENIRVIEKESKISLDGLDIMPYPIYHDAADPVGYTVCYKDKKMSIATDTGYIDSSITKHLKDSNLVLIESNHDINMLQAGMYPYYLKQRILGDKGHLSNEVAAKTLIELYNENLEYAVLGHLSRENNFPDLAYLTTKTKLESNGLEVDKDINLSIASNDSVSNIYRLI